MATIIGTNGDDTLKGGAGDDEIYGFGGNDTLDGGQGNNSLIGGSGDDTYLIRSRNDYIYDSGGNDKGVIYVDFYKTNTEVEQWTWAPGVQKLPYWIDALIPGDAPGYKALLGPSKVFHYFFPQTVPEYYSGDDSKGFKAFNAEQIAFAKKAFAYISTVVDVQFVETNSANDPNTIVLTNNEQSGSAGYAYYPYVQQLGSDLFLNYTGNSAGNLTPSNGTYSALTLIHELGHALGLKHPFLDKDSKPEDGPALPDQEDSTTWTVMSYNSFRANYQLKYSPFDIAALQYIYGPSKATQTNDTLTLTALSTNILWDGGGVDTIDGAQQTQAITLYLEPGYWGYIGAKNELLSKPGQITINFGTVIENAVGGSGNDTLVGNSIANNLRGGAGNDIISGLGGNDVIDGGTGLNTARFTHRLSDFIVSKQIVGAQTIFNVSDKTNIDGNDTLQNIQRLQFSDNSLAFDIKGNAGEAYRLYQAAFNRIPDFDGLGFWIGAIDSGASLKSVASQFISSQEFKTLYGANVNDVGFITNLYQNVLHRAPDQGGLDFWLRSLNVENQTRSDVLVGFSESNENQLQVIGRIENGIEYTSNFAVI
jgi:serralysin